MFCIMTHCLDQARYPNVVVLFWIGTMIYSFADRNPSTLHAKVSCGAFLLQREIVKQFNHSIEFSQLSPNRVTRGQSVLFAFAGTLYTGVVKYLTPLGCFKNGNAII